MHTILFHTSVISAIGMNNQANIFKKKKEEKLLKMSKFWLFTVLSQVSISNEYPKIRLHGVRKLIMWKFPLIWSYDIVLWLLLDFTSAPLTKPALEFTVTSFKWSVTLPSNCLQRQHASHNLRKCALCVPSKGSDQPVLCSLISFCRPLWIAKDPWL